MTALLDTYCLFYCTASNFYIIWLLWCPIKWNTIIAFLSSTYLHYSSENMTSTWCFFGILRKNPHTIKLQLLPIYENNDNNDGLVENTFVTSLSIVCLIFLCVCLRYIEIMGEAHWLEVVCFGCFGQKHIQWCNVYSTLVLIYQLIKNNFK